MGRPHSLGYLSRVRPNGNSRAEAIWLAVHEGIACAGVSPPANSFLRETPIFFAGAWQRWPPALLTRVAAALPRSIVVP